MDPQTTPFYERRGFQGAVAVIGLLTALWAFTGAPRPWQVATNISATTVPLSNTEIVLDASAKMATPFGDSTKLEAAKEAIGRYVAPLSNEGLALRRTGGACGESGDLLVGFDDDHGDDVRDQALAQRPAGTSNIANAVRAAIDDFQTDSFKKPNSTNRILVFISGEDECSEYPGEEIREELDRSNIDTAFRFVALKPSGREVKMLRSFTEELGPNVDAEIHTANSEKQLEDVIRHEARDAVREAAAAKAASSAPPPESKPADRPEEHAQKPDSSPSKGPQPPRERPEREATEKAVPEEACLEEEAPEKAPSEIEPTGKEPAETEPSKECAETEPLEKEPPKEGAVDAGPTEKEETSPGTTAPPEEGSPTTPSP